MYSASEISKREREILHLIAFEKTSIEISEILHISPETAKTHRKNLLAKLHARNVAGLMRRAFETGILKINAITN